MDEPPPVTAERNQDYRCTDDAYPRKNHRITDDKEEIVVSAKESDVEATISAEAEASGTPGKRAATACRDL